MNSFLFNSLLSLFIFFITLLLPNNKKLSFISYDNVNKNHSINKGLVPLISSLALIPPIFLYYEYNLTLIFISSFLFFIGYLDDKFNIKIKYRFFLSFIIIIFFQINFYDYRIEYLYFFNYYINFNYTISILVSLTMILGFFHVINMSDGRNCLVIIYFINIFIFLLLKNDSLFFYNNLLLLIVFLLVFILNYFNKSFFGNSGILFVSFFVAIVLISEFNNESLTIENIFVLLYIPFFDALRVTFVRVYNRKSPFLSERNHLHHLPENWNQALIILSFLFILNNIIQLYANLNFLYILSYSLFSFLIIYQIFKKI